MPTVAIETAPPLQMTMWLCLLKRATTSARFVVWPDTCLPVFCLRVRLSVRQTVRMFFCQRVFLSSLHAVILMSPSACSYTFKLQNLLWSEGWSFPSPEMSSYVKRTLTGESSGTAQRYNRWLKNAWSIKAVACRGTCKWRSVVAGTKSFELEGARRPDGPAETGWHLSARQALHHGRGQIALIFISPPDTC